ncbi:ferredoxin [Streptomyces sp. NPDC026672]|uniref:ferredoxin n=1 Tax=unclassified Streptomyces TaxID=2593676 RepID=UPI0033E5C4D2
MSDDWRLKVERSRCVGSTICVSTAPGVFAMDAEGQSRAERESVPAEERVMRAAELCPLEAISIIDGASGRELFPGER